MCSNQTTTFMNNKRRLTAPKSRTLLPKKPKFRSLRLQFPPEGTENTRGSSHMRRSFNAASSATSSHHQEDENVDFFSAADGRSYTLTGLLDNANVTNSSHSANDSCRPEESEERAALVRNSLRSGERDSSEDKWVSYSEVLETKVKDEEVTSSVVDLRTTAADDGSGIHRLSLKLNYDKILSAWSDKGPLYIHAESSQIVPDITCDFPSYEVSNNSRRKEWEVPEIENGEEIKMGQREASVLRYKAKREKRLLFKKIRYQVRKLNAEKRPRFKGRFVKRS